MSQPKQRQEDKVSVRKFSDMNAGEKLVHLFKVLVFLVTFGFAFPTIFSD
jgi:hypothetical protein